MNGKGCKPRKRFVDQKTWSENWNKIFMKDKDGKRANKNNNKSKR
jgi:hypothetical protein